ncbi:hypothetical protein CS8_055200 [Cupriavidus sp. 8B]
MGVTWHRSDSARHLIAVHVWQADIQKHHVGPESVIQRGVPLGGDLTNVLAKRPAVPRSRRPYGIGWWPK